MFKLPAPPSAKASHPELADFAELLCIDLGTASKQEILAHLGRVGENENNDGIEDDEGRTSDDLDDVMNELDRRSAACGARAYPFALTRSGCVLKRRTGKVTARSLIYEFLLLGTRLDMQEDKIQGGIDGTHLLEEISAVVLKNYLGADRAQSHVFGTANSGGFKDKVDNLCAILREGSHFRAQDPVVIQQDGTLDAVAWKPFTDARAGQLIVFAQCKTGTHWRKETARLQPSAFVSTWMHDTPVVEPLRAFCIAEACDGSRWIADGKAAGIVFDRCRLVDFCDDVPAPLLKRVVKWSTAAKKTLPYSQRPKKKRAKAN